MNATGIYEDSASILEDRNWSSDQEQEHFLDHSVSMKGITTEEDPISKPSIESSKVQNDVSSVTSAGYTPETVVCLIFSLVGFVYLI